MLPPVEDAVLQNNPEFAALYSTLTTVILNPDGTTKNDPAAKERDAVRTELKKHRLKAAKHSFIIHAISEASPSPSQPAQPPAISRRAKQPPPSSSSSSSPTELPKPLIDLLLLLPPLLQYDPSTSSEVYPGAITTLLSLPPLCNFPDHLPQLTPLISAKLHAQALQLARIANPHTNASYIHRTIPALPAHISSLPARMTDLKSTLTKTRLATATAITHLLDLHTRGLTELLRMLEAKHGAIARSLEFKAAEISLLAQQQETEVESALWTLRRDTYTPDTIRALQNYALHLRDARVRLGESIRGLQEQLCEYGVHPESPSHEGDHQGVDGQQKRAKERTMREMARVYRDMERQIEDVRKDLERLGRA